MSRQNKVNPGTYTQRGRLTQDDASRELRKQIAIRPSHTSPPANPPSSNARANAANPKAAPKAARARKPTRTGRHGDTRKPVTTAIKQTKKPARKAKLARKVGGARAAPRPTTKSRKS
jgi:hypothetical protein